MYHGPDLDTDSDDSFLDDYNFFSGQQTCNDVSSELTPEQQWQSKLDSLYYAISTNNIEEVTKCLDDGMETDTVLRDDWTPLLLASCYGDKELVKLLLERGASINQTRETMTALMLACNCPVQPTSMQNYLDVIKVLVENGVSVNAINGKRINALMFASGMGNILAVQYLLPLSNKEAVDNQGWNAFTWAVSHNEVEVAKYLFENGLAYTIIDIRGHTPFDIARDNELDDMLNIFPKRTTDWEYEALLNYSKETYQDFLKDLEQYDKPKFFSEICNILTAINCDHLIPIFIAKNVNFEEFLSANDEYLKDLGILLPFQRRKILLGLQRFHRNPYHPKSLHITINNTDCSNLDVAIQLTSAVQQIIAMDSSLKFIKNSLQTDISEEDREIILKNIKYIKATIKSFRTVNRNLNRKICQWDKMIEQPDHITKKSIRSKFPWKKTTFCLGVVTVVLLLKLKLY